jgi:hypothetical protein
MTEEISKIDLDCATIEFRKDGILHIHIKIEEVFEMEDAMKLLEARTKLAAGRKAPLVYTATKLVIPTKEVREFISSEKRSELVIADAFVVNSLPQKIMGNFFIRMGNPVRPIKVFKDFEEACAWARTYLD